MAVQYFSAISFSLLILFDFELHLTVCLHSIILLTFYAFTQSDSFDIIFFMFAIPMFLYALFHPSYSHSLEILLDQHFLMDSSQLAYHLGHFRYCYYCCGRCYWYCSTFRQAL